MDVSLLLIVPVWQGKLFIFCVKYIHILDDPPLALHRLGEGLPNPGAKVTQLTCTPKGMQIERIRRDDILAK